MGKLLRLATKEHNLGRYGRIKQTIPRQPGYEIVSALLSLGTALLWLLAALGLTFVIGAFVVL